MCKNVCTLKERYISVANTHAAAFMCVCVCMRCVCLCVNYVLWHVDALLLVSSINELLF